MVFSSFVFLFRFLPAVLAVYYCLPGCVRQFWLLLSSLLFYAWGEPDYVILLIFSIVVNYLFGILIGYYKNQCRRKAAGIVMITAVSANVLLLCVFKYSVMILELFENICSIQINFAGIILPAGISFYTFQSISYLADIWRGDVKPQRSIVSFGMYIAMFPQLIAGPVVRYKFIEAQIEKKQKNWRNDFSRDIRNLAYGIGRFVIGLSKKVILANNAGILWQQISGMENGELSGIMAWFGIMAFAFQIYFDFSGYSDMALGLAAMFGFRLEENFNYPYISKNITEFWRRWHISIGSWFREYVYIPLGGNRKGRGRHIFNILLVWMLTGLWHGASFNFLLWGFYFGVIILLEKYIILKALEYLPGVIQYVYSMILILFGWVIFEADSIGEAVKYFKALFGGNGWGIRSDSVHYMLYTGLFFMILLFIGATPLPAILWNKAEKMLSGGRRGMVICSLIKNTGYMALMLVSTAYLVEQSYNPFLYFRF
ncbi:MAG: MBOAT family protein [Lachnospiraceae bacterium]|nr:MBOAT family protein [Lachnospiraceae bacterium]